MINSGVLKLDHERDRRKADALSVLALRHLPAVAVARHAQGAGALTPGYESYYLRAVDPERPRGVWLRHTTLGDVGSTWLTLFDADAPEPVTAKVSVPGPVRPAGSWLRVGDSEIRPDGVRGPDWDLRWAGDEPRAAAPPERLDVQGAAPADQAREPAAGHHRRRHACTAVAVDGWRGMIGHNWGAEHAERWIWLHGTLFEDAPDAWLDIALGRIKVAGRTTPWIANGVVSIGGQRTRVGGLRARPSVEEDALQVRLELPGLKLTARSPREQTVVWRYGDHRPHGELLDRRARRRGRRPAAAHARTAARTSSGCARRRTGCRSSRIQTPEALDNQTDLSVRSAAMRYGVLGTGSVGRTLAGKLESLGHEVRTGGRGAYAEVAAFAEVVVNATPGAVTLDVLREATRESIAGKVLIDVSNPLDFSEGFPPKLTVANTDSVGEQIQREFPDAKVVKGFNTVTAEVMVAPDRVPGDHNLFICGDEDGKRQFVETAGEFGWPAERILDLGPIDAARGIEMYLAFWVRLYGAVGDRLFNIAVVKA